MYAFLVWRSAESFARRDVTAGPRGKISFFYRFLFSPSPPSLTFPAAIYFSWTQMPMDTWSNTLEIDKIMGEDLRNPTICDRYAFVIKVNLSKLCSVYKGISFLPFYSLLSTSPPSPSLPIPPSPSLPRHLPIPYAE